MGGSAKDGGLLRLPCPRAHPPFGSPSPSPITPTVRGSLPQGLLDTSDHIWVDKEDEELLPFPPEILNSHCPFIFIMGPNIALNSSFFSNPLSLFQGRPVFLLPHFPAST